MIQLVNSLFLPLPVFFYFSAELVKVYGVSKPNGITYVPNRINCERDSATGMAASPMPTSTENPELEYKTEVSVHPAYKDSYSIQASVSTSSNSSK